MSGAALAVALLFAGPFITYTWEPAPGRVSLYQIDVRTEDQPQMLYYTTGPGIRLSPPLGHDVQLRVRACGAGCGPWSELSTPISLNRNADLDGDDAVGFLDSVMLGDSFGGAGPGDLTGDGIVTTADLLELNDVFGLCTGYTLLDGRAVPAYIDCLEAR